MRERQARGFHSLAYASDPLHAARSARGRVAALVGPRARRNEPGHRRREAEGEKLLGASLAAQVQEPAQRSRADRAMIIDKNADGTIIVREARPTEWIDADIFEVAD